MGYRYELDVPFSIRFQVVLTLLFAITARSDTGAIELAGRSL